MLAVARSNGIYIYLFIHTHICCRVKLGPRFGFFELKLGPKVASKLGPRFSGLFSLILECFLVILKKTQIVCRGAKIVFGSLSGWVFEKKCAFFVFVFFYVGAR